MDKKFSWWLPDVASNSQTALMVNTHCSRRIGWDPGSPCLALQYQKNWTDSYKRKGERIGMSKEN